MANAVIYCRVSDPKQIDNTSLGSQESACRDFAAKKGYEVVEIFIEKGESAKTMDRTELIRMMGYVSKNKGKIQALIVYKVDRIARNQADHQYLKTKFRGYGVDFVSATEMIDNSPMGRLMENSLATFAQFDNEVRAERCRNGMVELAKKGTRSGRMNIGYQKRWIDEKTRVIEQVEPYASHIKRAFELLNTGLYTQEAVRRILHGEGFRETDGREVSSQHFKKIIDNPIYKGILIDFGVNEKLDCEPIVSWTLFESVQSLLRGKARKMPRYQKNRMDFVLRGSMKCVHNKKATGSSCRGNGGIYHLYRFDCPECKGRKRNFTNADIHSKFASYLGEVEYDNKLVDELRIAISLNWEKRNSFVLKKAKGLENKTVELKAKEQKIIDKMIDGVFSDEIGKEQLNKIKTEQLFIESEIDNLSIPKRTESNVIEFGLNYMRNLSDEWQNQNNLEIKQRFQNYFFPEGITFNQNQEFETAVSPLCMRIKALYATENCSLVASRGIEPLLPH